MAKKVDIPKLIGRIRKKHDLTQEALARRLGVSVVTINRWQRGHNRPHQAFEAKLKELV